MSNYAFADFIAHLNNTVENIPWIVDSSGIDPELKVDMTFTIKSFDDIPALRKILNTYGLDLIADRQQMEVYVITEDN